jgi:hypothetical protein
MGYSGYSDAHSTDGARSRLRCAAVQRARRRPLTAPARPPMPLRVRRKRMRVLRVPCRPTVPRGISIGISCNDGDPPRPRDALPLGRETVPLALEDLSSEGTLHTLAVLRDVMQVLTVPRALRAPNVRTTDRDGSGQLCCPIANEHSRSACALGRSVQRVAREYSCL